MIVLHRKHSKVNNIDGAAISPLAWSDLSVESIAALDLSTDVGTVTVGQIFDVTTLESSNESTIVIVGDCSDIHSLGANMSGGTLCVLGSVGSSAAKSMTGGTLRIVGDAKDHLASGLVDGQVFVSGNCGNNLASPLPGRKSGMRGGDLFIGGNVGERACERLRRGTVFIAGNVGEYAASQLIAGTLVILGELGDNWAGGMRRGSLILGRDHSSVATASLSEPRDFELSFLPLVWRHVEGLQANAIEKIVGIDAVLRVNGTRISSDIPEPIKIPRTRWVQRQIADLNFDGRGEVLVLRRNSSPGVR